jgi:hypothetical protein
MTEHSIHIRVPKRLTDRIVRVQIEQGKIQGRTILSQQQTIAHLIGIGLDAYEGKPITKNAPTNE